MEFFELFFKEVSFSALLNGFIVVFIMGIIKPITKKGFELVEKYTKLREIIEQKIKLISESEIEQFKVAMISNRILQIALTMLVLSFISVNIYILSAYFEQPTFNDDFGDFFRNYAQIFFLLYILAAGDSIVRQTLLFKGLDLREKNKISSK